MIKAIETQYKGYRFRSRLEARWAVFFDTLGIEWEYEKEGFDLGALGQYLPDFWLKNVGVRGYKKGMFAEIKGEEATDIEIEKLARLSVEFGHAAMLHGGIGEHPDLNEFLEVWWDERYNYPYHDLPMAFMKCEGCGDLKYEFPEYNYMTCDCSGKYNDFHPDIINAYNAARSARFEFGESG